MKVARLSPWADTRVLILGNCHAQYLGAALRLAPNVDVKVVGKPFEGPVHVKGVLPSMIDLKSGFEWIAGSPQRPVVISQTTPKGRDGFSEKLNARGVENTAAYFPFIRFGVLDLNVVQDGPEGERLIKRTIRKDRIFNELSVIAAGGTGDDLDYIERGLVEEPAFYMNSHYTGAVYARIFGLLRRSALAEALGYAEFDAFIHRVSQDPGIGHLLGPLPHVRVMESLGIKWSFADAVRTAGRCLAGPNPGAHDVIRGNGVVSFALFRSHYKIATDQNSLRSLNICIRIYRSNRFYLRWSDLLAIALFRRNKPMLATIVLLHRMAWDDARGSMFEVALRHVRAMSRSEHALRVIDRYAERYPDSNISILPRIVARFRT